MQAASPNPSSGIKLIMKTYTFVNHVKTCQSAPELTIFNKLVLGLGPRIDHVHLFTKNKSENYVRLIINQLSLAESFTKIESEKTNHFVSKLNVKLIFCYWKNKF